MMQKQAVFSGNKDSYYAYLGYFYGAGCFRCKRF